MKTDIFTCKSCGAKNRVDLNKVHIGSNKKPKCGKCGEILVSDWVDSLVDTLNGIVKKSGVRKRRRKGECPDDTGENV